MHFRSLEILGRLEKAPRATQHIRATRHTEQAEGHASWAKIKIKHVTYNVLCLAEYLGLGYNLYHYLHQNNNIRSRGQI